MLPELHACQEAEDFFEALAVPFDRGVLEAHRVSVLRRFGELLVEVIDRHPGADQATLRALARAALQEVHGAARAGRLTRSASSLTCGACAPGARCFTPGQAPE